MFRAEILWLANGPTLKMEGRLVGEWAEQARYLVTTDLVPKGLIVDLTEVSYVDSAGERLLSWLGSVGAVFVASGVYAPAVCERLGLSPVRRIPARRHGNNAGSPQLHIPMQVDAGPGRHQKEEQ
ncbi:MAG: hypothetical protein WCC99_10790 [Candidatus Sulfotelmatobacter sp.]